MSPIEIAEVREARWEHEGVPIHEACALAVLEATEVTEINHPTQKEPK